MEGSGERRSPSRYLRLFIAASAAIFILTKVRADIRGSKHDFSAATGTPLSACLVCHVAADPATGKVFPELSGHTGTGFAPYRSPSLKSRSGLPDGVTRFCLGCHEGSIAPEASFGPASAPLGSDLSDDHPVSFLYDKNLAASAKHLKDPSTSPSGLGGTIASDLLRNGKMECVSCHDPHNPGPPAFLVKSNRKSALCFTCHDL